MKAVAYDRYGPPEVMRLVEMAKPVPGAGEVLVRVHASSVTSGDVRLRKPDPSLVRLFNGLSRPKRIRVLGSEFSGEIEAVGASVTRFRSGDRVFGSAGVSLGANAEHLRIPESGALAIKPAGLTDEEAAAIPFGAATSLVFLRDKGKIRSGQRVLVYGASGALGVYAVQIAGHYGAEVTGVCSGANADLVRKLGADKVIDYTKESLAAGDAGYDIIFDTVGKSPFAACLRSLRRGGAYLRAVHMDPGSLIRGAWTSWTGGKSVQGGMAVHTQEHMLFLKHLIEQGGLKPVIDRVYGLEDAAEAHRYVDSGHKKGAVVLRVRN